MHALQPITAVTDEAGEDRALRYLQACGLVVVSRNYYCKGDGIDLVICDATGALVFVELRARMAHSTQRFGGAAANVTPAKQRRLIATAEDFLTRQVEDVPACRFDVIAINGAYIKWMRDAFGVDTRTSHQPRSSFFCTPFRDSMKLSSPMFARFRRTVTHTAVLAALAGMTATQLTACFPLFADAVAGGVALATDCRPTATQTIDRGLQMEAENTLISRYDSRAHVNVTAYNRKVLLAGKAGTEQTKQEIGQCAQKLQNAREVVNEIVVTSESSTFGSRVNNTYITTKVKSVLAGAEGVSRNSIKVATEAQTVLLLGVVTEAKDNKATEAVRTVGGVNKVMKVFDYMTDEERKHLDANATSTNPSTAPDAS